MTTNTNLVYFLNKLNFHDAMNSQLQQANEVVLFFVTPPLGSEHDQSKPGKILYCRRFGKEFERTGPKEIGDWRKKATRLVGSWVASGMLPLFKYH